MSNNGAIGVFDSGLGGLTVVKEIKKLHPKAKIIYLGDTARVPYGTRSKETVVQFALEDAKFLEKKGVDLMVIACNTASALAYEEVKKACRVPVYEVISAAKLAAEKASKNGKIGVIGTRGTIGSGAYGHVGQACPLLVPFVEEGELSGKALELVVKRYLQPLKEAGVDTLILGCTHYPIIAGVIGGEMGSEVRLINPGEELAKRLDLRGERGEDEYYVTDMTPRYAQVAARFLGHGISPKLVKL